jgi:hypothetical protein
LTASTMYDDAEAAGACVRFSKTRQPASAPTATRKESQYANKSLLFGSRSTGLPTPAPAAGTFYLNYSAAQHVWAGMPATTAKLRPACF